MVAFILLSGILFGLLICEVFLRIVDYNYVPMKLSFLDRADTRFTDFHRKLHESNNINLEISPFTFWQPKKNRSPFNKQGFRGREINAKDDKNLIFTFGDSNTCGPFLTYSWSEYLQGFIDDNHHMNTPVINAGVWGYSSLQVFNRFEECLKYKPRIVLVSWCSNDALSVAISDSDYMASKKMFSFLGSLKIFKLAWAVHDKLLFANRKNGIEPCRRLSLVEYENYLKKIIEIGKKNNMQVVLLTRPYHGKPDNEVWDWKNYAPDYNNLTLKMADNNGLLAIDLYSFFKDKDYLFCDESHFNDQGNRLAAKIIYDRLKNYIPYQKDNKEDNIINPFALRGNWDSKNINNKNFLVAQRDEPLYSDVEFMFASAKLPVNFYLEYIDNVKGNVTVNVVKDDGQRVKIGDIVLTNSGQKKIFTRLVSFSEIFGDNKSKNTIERLYIVLDTNKMKFFISKICLTTQQSQDF